MHRNGVVSRRRVVRALEASGVELRSHGGEVIVVGPSFHFRFGARRGVGPVLLQRLIKEMARAGLSTELIEHRLGSTPRAVR